MNSNSTPVSATSAELENFRQSLSQLQTPGVIDRVVDWMGINEMASFEYEIEEKKNDDLGTFFRCDYKVDDAGSQMQNADTNLTSIFNKSVPLCESPKSIESISTCDMQREAQHKISPRIGNEFLDPYLLKKNISPIILPLSVDSKKKELCSYLKLMTRGHKKEVFSSRCRRSTRVQNLERKRKTPTKNLYNDDEICSEKSTKTNKSKFSERCESIALQSFEDLNMIVDTSKYPFLLENVERKIFNFVMPPDNVLMEFNDFKHWIEPILSNHTYENGTINVQYHNCNNHNPMENHRDNQEMKVKVSETNRIDRKNEELNRFRKRIKKKTVINGEPCQYTEEIFSTGDKKMELNNTDYIHDSSTNHKNGNKCIFLLHDETIINGLSVDNSVQDMPNIEEVDVDNVQIKDSENIKIRIDYELTKSIKELRDSPIPSGDNSSKSNELPILYCPGFSKKDIEKSEESLSKFKLSTSCIQPIPKKNPIKKYLKCSKTLTENEKFDCCSREDIILNETESNIISCDEDLEEVRSISSESCSSISSLPSNDSSTSKSNTISHKESLKNQSMQKFDRISPSQITPRPVNVLPFTERSDVQTLHNLLKRQAKKVPNSVIYSAQDWDSDNSISGKPKFGSGKNNSHFVSLNQENGFIQNAIYVDFHLILIQEYAVSMWNQTALGNVLGAQNLWIFNGDTKKLILNKECTRKHSLEMAVSMENCVAYVELWTKEHKSDIRQGPVADIFAIVYFWFQKLNKMDKKVHQLENINGFSDDVQYVVLKSSLNIVVSWHSVVDDLKVTQVRVYTLATDFQTIVNVRAMSRVDHYVSSLHNIEDCEELLMGCGEHTITLWNIEHGYVVASVKLNDIKLSLLTLWAKCDRGILFTVQQCVDKELRLIAINGRSHSWKKLKSYKPPDGFERIQNVYIENGVLISFYEEGILCWKAQTAEQILEENHETDMKYFPSGKYVIMTTEKSIFIRHALTHLLTAD